MAESSLTIELEPENVRMIEEATEAAKIATRWRKISSVLDLIVVATVLADWVLR